MRACHAHGRRDRACRRATRRSWVGGFTLIEMLFTVALGVTILGIAVPAFLSGLEEARTRSAARYLAGRLRLARAIAVARSRAVGVRFERAGDDYRYTVYEDGDRDGIRTADIRRGIDREIAPAERLAYTFSGVRFGFLDGVGVIDNDDRGGAGDPIRAGASSIMTFSPNGSATGGTLYLRGKKRSQYAVRVLGVTARTRVFQFHTGTGRWTER
jgi:type II secretory pathway pseudopilin PulG